MSAGGVFSATDHRVRLSFRNGYWQWSYRNITRTGYVCLVCAIRSALDAREESVTFASQMEDAKAKRAISRSYFEKDSDSVSPVYFNWVRSFSSGDGRVIQCNDPVAESFKTHGDPAVRRNRFQELYDGLLHLFSTNPSLVKGPKL